MTRLNSVQLRTGFDQTLGDAYNIEGFTPNTGNPLTRHISKAGDVYIWVEGEPVYSPGQERFSPNPSMSTAGLEVVQYTTPQMHIDSYDWLYTNYSGMVTANIRTRGTTYARYNCQLRFKNQDSQLKNFPQVTWIFTLIEAL